MNFIKVVRCFLYYNSHIPAEKLAHGFSHCLCHFRAYIFAAFFTIVLYRLKKVNKCSIFLTKPLAFLFFSCIIDSETRTDVLIIEHPRIDQERMLKMERTYVLNFIFKVLAACGVIAVFGVAGLSDGGVLSTAEVFIYGVMSFLTASFGVWGTYNCTKAIEAEKLRRKRERARMRRASAYKIAA